VLGGLKRVAMEYSPGNAIPYISRVDAGTVEAVRALGADVLSSGDLVQRFEAVWSDDALRRIAPRPRPLPDQGSRVRLRPRRARAGRALTEIDVQRAMAGWFDEEGLVTTRRPSSARRRTPAIRTTCRPARSTARSATARSCCSTSGASCRAGRRLRRHHVGRLHGPSVPDEYVKAFNAARDGRDAAIALVKDACRAGQEIRGFEVDRACRDGARRRGLRRRVHPPHGHSLVPRSRQRRAHGRLRDARRAPAHPRHRLYDRAGRLYERVRRADRDQYVSSASARPP
jgi:hypothetical protein